MITIKQLPPLATITEQLEFNFDTGQVFRKFVKPTNDLIKFDGHNYKFCISFNKRKFETMRATYESICQYRDAAFDLLEKERIPVVIKPDEKGYQKIRINGEIYPLHRVIYYAYHKTDMGKLQVDHIDMNKSNNSIHNLRLSDGFGQNGNRVIQKNNKSGFRGVRHYKKQLGDKVYNYWIAEILKDRKRVFQKLYPFTDDGFKQACIDVEEKRKEHFVEYYNGTY